MLEDGDGDDRAGPPIADTQPPALPGPALRRLDGSAAATAAAEPCADARAHRVTSSTGWAATSRAPSSPRAPSRPSFSQSSREPPTRCRASASARAGCSRCSGTSSRDRARRTEALGQLTLDAERPGSMLASIERAREGARTVRDVISAEMWEAINTTTLGLRGGGQPGWAAPAGPYLASQYVKERTALIWGVAARSMLRDEAKCFLDAGGPDRGRRTWCCGCFASRSRPRRAATRADGHALILLQAVGGFHAYLRAVTAPPNAHPVARFLLFERAYPDSVAACVDSLHEAFTRRRRRPAQLEAGAARQPPGGRPRLPAPRAARRRRAQRHLRADPAGAGPIDQDVADRYFAGAAPAGERR